MGDDEGRWHDLEAEDPVAGGTPQPIGDGRAQPVSSQVRLDPAQHRIEETPGPATWVEDIDPLVGEPIRNAEIVLQCAVDARDGSVAKIVRERVRSAASWQSSGRGQVLV